MKSKKLDLNAFKKMAECVQKDEVLEKIVGGKVDLYDCHGIWGKVGKEAKRWGEFLDAHPRL